ncbi:hypothetical protein DDQ41_21485 [Streptomyces spongiicola]|uniref:Uncharacterized protein n=1 Tax=Streptomyces spongiicola TaxID=1690221 RepID=A0ABN5KLN0_9ACTN|nr:hypothetical protein DDQ41_21485 [Streptomyces spongiicola]
MADGGAATNALLSGPREGRLPSAACRLPPAACHLPSAVCHLPAAVCRTSGASRRVRLRGARGGVPEPGCRHHPAAAVSLSRVAAPSAFRARPRKRPRPQKKWRRRRDFRVVKGG